MLKYINPTGAQTAACNLSISKHDMPCGPTGGSMQHNGRAPRPPHGTRIGACNTTSAAVQHGPAAQHTMATQRSTQSDRSGSKKTGRFTGSTKNRPVLPVFSDPITQTVF